MNLIRDCFTGQIESHAFAGNLGHQKLECLTPC